jgi:hypothetical protein
MVAQSLQIFKLKLFQTLRVCGDVEGETNEQRITGE